MDASEHRIGTNVTVIDPESEAVEAVRGFDTSANEWERDSPQAFIDEVPEGKIVVVALKGLAANFLNEETVLSFKTPDAATGPTDHGVSYAHIGVKGAPEGSALEGEAKGNTVDLAHQADERPLSVAVDWIRWEQ